MIRALVLMLALAAIPAGCGYAVRFGVPPSWWQDGGATGSGHLKTEPLLGR
jgi:hypothetical protein